MNASFKFPAGKVNGLLKKWEKLAGDSYANLLRDRAGMLGRYMAASTQPARPTGEEGPPGGTKEEQNIGINAIVSDIAMIVQRIKPSASILPARGQQERLVIRYGGKKGRKNRKGERVQAGQAYIIDRDLFMTNPQTIFYFHQSKRSAATGRVSRAGAHADVFRGRWKNREVAVTTGETRKDYVATAKKLVGWAKAGWITAARSISSVGFSKVPVWIKKEAPGSAVANFSGSRQTLRLINGVKYSDEVLRPTYRDKAIAGFTKSLLKDIQFRVEDLMKKRKL